MEQYREIIDNLDNQIMELLIDRLLVVKDIGEFKKKINKACSNCKNCSWEDVGSFYIEKRNKN